MNYYKNKRKGTGDVEFGCGPIGSDYEHTNVLSVIDELLFMS